jgi:oligoribonuclease NrnB/cAMP/cGMP phosphodiesterase (DHH superfamily)
METITIFYHRKDMDGLASGAIARHYLKSKNYSVREVPFDYYDDFPTDIPEGSKIVFMDVVIQPYAKMFELKDRYKVIVIDHHKTWIETPGANTFMGLISTEKSGCMLTWEYFYPNIEMPKLIKNLGLFDIWDKEDAMRWKDEIVPTNFAALSQNMHPSIKRPGEPLDNFIDSYINDYFKLNTESQEARMRELIAVGKQVWNYTYYDDAQTASAAAMECEFFNHNCIMINSRRNSFAFDTVYDPKRHYMKISWYYTKDGYSFSLYCDDAVTDPSKDLSKIAKLYGGGGHAGACGFQADYVHLFDVEENGKKIKCMVALKKDPNTGLLYHPNEPTKFYKERVLELVKDQTPEAPQEPTQDTTTESFNPMTVY